MARVFQAPQAQQVFRQPRAYTPTAQATEGADQQFRTTLDQRLQTVYADLANQYENRQLNDQGFASQMEAVINGVPDESVRQKWEPILTQVKYTVFSNAQALEDAKIQSELVAGKITAQQAAARYQAMSAAAIAQNSQSALRDAATWDLKGNQIIEASKRGSGGSGSSLSAKDLFDVQASFDQLDYLKQQAQDNETTANAALNDPNTFAGLSQSDQDSLRKQLTKSISDGWDDYYSTTEKFANSDLYYSYYNENTSAAQSKLNSNLDAIHQQGGKVFIPSGYDVGYTDYPVGNYTPGQEQPNYQGSNVGETIGNYVGATDYGKNLQSDQSKQVSSVSIPTVAPQTSYQSNPLGLGTGGPSQRTVS